ncbi:MAG: glycosyl hydrolase [Kiritimatiellae bacterium]|jgi:hypothetical protein|nr:glycosyl hydrolase [Kiritimatiellia bacterium]
METLLSADPDARIMMRWWWFGPTITPKEIDRELGLMKDAGIGGVEVAFLYPVTLRTEASPELYDFLSPAFLNSLGHAAESAKRLGLVFDITLGSGWPYGGPHVTAPLQARKLKILDVTLDQGISEYEVPKENEDAEIVAATCGGRPVEFTKRHAVLHGPLNKPSRLRLLLSVPSGQRVK